MSDRFDESFTNVSNSPPTVSLLVAMRNESGHIQKCLTSVLAQDYPAEKLEVWVFDGQSTDDSWAIVESMFSGRPNCFLVQNPKRIQSAAWNLGIERSGGDIVGIVSAHTELAVDYVSTAVETLLRTKADMVGGPACAFGVTPTGKAVALATSSPFGVGGARFHYTQREEQVDTVFMGLCWRRLYERVGGFDEELVRDQDDELSYRILSSGGQIVCNPRIKSFYYNRSTLRSLWRQYFQYGFWKVRVMQKVLRQMRVRQFVPSMFVLGLATTGLMSTFGGAWRYPFIICAGAYVFSNVAATIWLLVKNKGWNINVIYLVPTAFLILHLSYGLGFLIGLAKFSDRWNEVNSARRIELNAE